MPDFTVASHELALCEINNGERYTWRCRAAKYPATEAAATFATFAKHAAMDYVAEFCNRGDQPFTAEDILLCAIELEAYYRQHVAETEAVEASET